MAIPRSGDSDTIPLFPKWQHPYQPTVIVGKTFHNQEVLLDGYAYESCTFVNVTFVYNGTTPLQFAGNHVEGFPGVPIR